MQLLLFIAGLALLIAGADQLVRGASRLALSMGLSPLVVGLTVVAFGTSAPEMAVSVQSAVEGNGAIAIGNVIGSNICNVLLILGLSAAIAPLAVTQKLVRVDVPLVLAATLVAWLLLLDRTLGRLDGVLLFAGIVAYTVFAIRQSRREAAAVRKEGARSLEEGAIVAGKAPARRRGGIVVDVLRIVVGLGMLVAGADWLVEGATTLARTLGVGDLVIGLTIVAAGTSLPELATSVLASIRGERDIAVGNVIGSNLFNLLAVMGLAGVFAPGGIEVPATILAVDFPILLAVSIACLPVFFTGYSIDRWEGIVFVGYYVAYTTFLVLAATGHEALGTFRSAMLFFVIPLTVLTLGESLRRSLSRRHRASG